MDRNFEGDGATEVEEVALHPEGVDRNTNRLQIVNTLLVALHPEGVDRNQPGRQGGAIAYVALHPEGVDRNGTWLDYQASALSRPPPGGRG